MARKKIESSRIEIPHEPPGDENKPGLPYHIKGSSNARGGLPARCWIGPSHGRFEVFDDLRFLSILSQKLFEPRPESRPSLFGLVK